jgi:hypothetical protein
LVSELQALLEGVVAGSLSGWHGWGCGRPSVLLADLVEEVGLGVQPGAGHTGALREHADGDGLLGVDQLPQGGDGAATGVLGAGVGGLGEVAAVVSFHRGPAGVRAR